MSLTKILYDCLPVSYDGEKKRKNCELMQLIKAVTSNSPG